MEVRYRQMLGQLVQSMQCDVSNVANGTAQLSLPSFEVSDIESLCADAKDIFAKEPLLLDITGPITVIGDLHGQILDLFRILQTKGLPIAIKYLFLGDFVDRGDFSFETITFVFLLKVLNPENVLIIRGNHEFESVCATGGFGQELNLLYHNQAVFFAFITAFAQMPIACLIDRNILAVHGGIGPDLHSIQDLRQIRRPIPDFDDSVLDSILWSDPSDEIEMYEKSQRGTGYLFGATAFNKFLEHNVIRLVIRGHECVEEGIQEHFGGKLVTVFSASNYCGSAGNSAAVLIVGRQGELKPLKFPPIRRFRRSEAVFPDAPKSEKRTKPIKPRVPIKASLTPTLSPQSLMPRPPAIRSPTPPPRRPKPVGVLYKSNQG
jgi:protein phosphatase